MNSIIYIIALSMIDARHIRQRRPTVALYAKSGRHLAMSSNGHVHMTIEPRSIYTHVELVSTGDNQFHIRSTETGRYLSVAKTNSKRKHLITTSSKKHATVFTEELLSNNYNSYAMFGNKNCRLSVRKSTKVRVVCRKRHRSTSVSFLPRRVHRH